MSIITQCLTRGLNGIGKFAECPEPWPFWIGFRHFVSIYIRCIVF
jgi:hypothetical protein